MSAEQDSTIINLLSNVKIALQFADGNWITFQTGGVELTTFTVGYSGVTFNDILTTSSFSMSCGAITQSSSNPLEYTMTMTWIPKASCLGKFQIKIIGQQGNTECITYLVGTSASKFICTSYVNGIA
ncbi:unnamed protein product, partial [Rotaria sordida]